MIAYLQGQYRKALSSLHQMASMQHPQPGQQSPSGQASLEQYRALIQQASCHYALGEYRVHTYAQTHIEPTVFLFVFFIVARGFSCANWTLFLSD